MKVVIIEDEKLAGKVLSKMLEQLEPEIEILAQLPSIAKVKEWFAQNPQPDLLFVDIQLSDGVSFEIFEDKSIQTPVIFTTAYNEYAIRAFKLNSIDYLLKPIEKQALKDALEKWKIWQKAFQANENFQVQLQSLLQNFQSQNTHRQFKERFLVHHGNTILPISIQDIMCFQKDEIILIHTQKQEKYIAKQNTLEEIEELLDPSLFFRANRQFIVHIENVKHLKNTQKGAELQLKSPDKCKINISREKIQSLKYWLES